MPSIATTMSSDSQNPSETVIYGPDDRPALTLTQAACDLLAEDDDEFAFVCPGCLRPLMYCSCALSER